MKTARERVPKRTPRELAEELILKATKAILHNDDKTGTVLVDFSDFADTLTPLLEEIDAARTWRDMENYDWRIKRSVKDKYKFAYDAIRKRNEELNE